MPLLTGYTLGCFMELTKEQLEKIDRRCEYLRGRFELFSIEFNLLRDTPAYVQACPNSIFHTRDKAPTTLRLMRRYVAMTKKELWEQTVADTVIMGNAWVYEGAFQQDVFAKYDLKSQEYKEAVINHGFEIVKARLEAIRRDPALLAHVPKEDAFIWKRLDELLALSDAELRETLVAENEMEI